MKHSLKSWLNRHIFLDSSATNHAILKHFIYLQHFLLWIPTYHLAFLQCLAFCFELCNIEKTAYVRVS